MTYKVRFVEPAKVYRMIKDELDAKYFEVMSSGDLIDRGQLRQFEENLAAFVGTKYAVGLNSGYDALHMSLRAAGIGPGDEVIVPAHTFVATCSAVVNVGATPILVDVGKDFNIDCDKVEEVLKSAIRNPQSRIKGIIPVHLSGYMADMPRIMGIAEKYGLVVVEDACQSLGASIVSQESGVRSQRSAISHQEPQVRTEESADSRQLTADSYKKKAGSWGLTGCWSFYPFKILGGYGDGGAITTNDPDVALFARRMRYNGEDRDTGEYHGHGFTCLLDNLQAAFLDVKLRYLPGWIRRRKAIAEQYRQGLSALPDLLLPHYDRLGFDHVYQNYTVRSKQGNDFSEYLKANGVEVLTQFRKPYYKHQALKLEDRGYPETEALSREVCSLPMNVEITDEEVEYVIGVVRSFYRK
jgi:dTDP-4-amino-4,6-dideoxygalactose transaminase